MIVKPGIPENLRWFCNARFGFMIHYGIYSQLGRGEWVMYHEKIKLGEYKRLMDTFNPSRFDADEWVDLAYRSGAGYIVFTSKHHDGFCMFDSAYTDYKITNTPFGRDLMGELIDACHRRGMPIIIYYSQPDWSHKNYVNHPGAFKDLDYTPEGQGPDWDKYLKYMFAQVEEICSKYGKIDGIFFDGSHKTREEWRGDELYALIKRYNPDAVVNDRARCGDYYTPERKIIDDIDAELAGNYLIEVCQSVMPRAWGYRPETEFYTAPKLISEMVRAARINCNFALNAGPAPDGTIPKGQAEVYRAIGRWMERSGEGYRYTRPVNIGMPRDCVTLTRGDTLYVYMLKWPDTTSLTVPRVSGRVRGARLLSTGEPLTFTRTEDGVKISGLPLVPPDALTQAVALDFYGDIKADECPPAPPARPARLTLSGLSLALTPEKALFVGYGVKGSKLTVAAKQPPELSDSAIEDTDVGADGLKRYITGFMTPYQRAVWELESADGGEVSFALEINSPGDYSDCVIKLEAGGETLLTRLPGTRGFFRLPLGTLPLKAGVTCVELSAAELKWGYTFPLVGALTVTPVK